MDKFCKFCGSLHTMPEYPKTCTACNQVSWINPIPVAVLGLRVRDFAGKKGILIGERGIPPHKGQMALISGFVDPTDKSIEHAAVRELSEETGITISHTNVKIVSSHNVGRNMLIFCRTSVPMNVHDVLNQFKANEECPRIDIAWAPQELAFDMHTKMLKVFAG